MCRVLYLGRHILQIFVFQFARQVQGVSDIALPDGVEALAPQDATIVISKPPSVRHDKVEEAEVEAAAE